MREREIERQANYRQTAPSSAITIYEHYCMEEVD